MRYIHSQGITRRSAPLYTWRRGVNTEAERDRRINALGMTTIPLAIVAIALYGLITWLTGSYNTQSLSGGTAQDHTTINVSPGSGHQNHQKNNSSPTTKNTDPPKQSRGASNGSNIAPTNTSSDSMLSSIITPSPLSPSYGGRGSAATSSPTSSGITTTPTPTTTSGGSGPTSGGTSSGPLPTTTVTVPPAGVQTGDKQILSTSGTSLTIN